MNLELTGGNLSQHISILVEAKLVEVEKGYEGNRPRTWITITKSGKLALRDEIKQLKALIARIEAN